MRLPAKSTWHILKGTWFVYNRQKLNVHIQLKNNGMQLVYVNGTLANKVRSLKLKTEQLFEFENDKYVVRTSPANKAMTSFTTELILNGELLRTYTFSYRTDLKRYFPFLLLVVGLTIPMALLKLPDWSYYVMLGIVVLLKIFIFNKSLFEIKEVENKFSVDI